MCVIAYATGHPQGWEASLRRMKTTNPDGIGIAWRKSEGVLFRKGISFDALIEIVKKFDKDTFWVVHFRKASSGKINPEMCHPFLVSPRRGVRVKNGRLSDGEWLLFHNGTIFIDGDLRKKYPLYPREISDTCVMASELRKIQIPLILRIVGLFGSGGGSKFVFLAKDGVYTIGDFKEEAGFVCSNTYWNYREIETSRFTYLLGRGYLFNGDREKSNKKKECEFYNDECFHCKITSSFCYSFGKKKGCDIYERGKNG